MKKFFMLGIAGILGVVFFSNNLLADPIGPDCETCQGSIYTLSYLPAPVDSFEYINTPNHGPAITVTGQIWEITLTINTAGYSGSGLYIKDVAIKAASSVEDSPYSSLFSAPGDAAAWTLFPGGLNSGGCDGHGSGFLCTSDGTAADLADSDTFSWVFYYATQADLFTDPMQASIKARYVDANGNKVGALVSEEITLQLPPPCSGDDCGGPEPVPEPTTLLLLGAGLAGIGIAAWRRKNK